LNAVKGITDVRRDSTGPTPHITGLTRKASDISSNLVANLTFLGQSRMFALQDYRKIPSSPGNPFRQKVILGLLLDKKINGTELKDGLDLGFPPRRCKEISRVLLIYQLRNLVEKVATLSSPSW